MPFKNKKDLIAYRKKYNATRLAKKRRAANNKARRMMKRKLGSAAIKGKDIGHKRAQADGGSTTYGNLKVQSVKSNRGKKPRSFKARNGRK
jgi:hypothetical protein